MNNKLINKLTNLTEIQGPVLVIDHATAMETMVHIHRLEREIKSLIDAKYVEQIKLPFNVGDKVWDKSLARYDEIVGLIISQDKAKTVRVRWQLANHTGHVDRDDILAKNPKEVL